MDKFSIVALGGNTRDIPFLLKELRLNNLISGTEKDVGGDTVYFTHNLFAIKKIMEDYEGIMLDIVKQK